MWKRGFGFGFQWLGCVILRRRIVLRLEGRLGGRYLPTVDLFITMKRTSIMSSFGRWVRRTVIGTGIEHCVLCVVRGGEMRLGGREGCGGIVAWAKGRGEVDGEVEEGISAKGWIVGSGAFLGRKRGEVAGQ